MYEIIFPQDEMDRHLLSGALIKNEDPKWGHARGWYVCDLTGRFHLHSDGIVRFGVCNDETAFWPDEKSAREAYEHWKSGRI